MNDDDLCAEDLLHVIVDVGGRTDAELLDKDIQYVGRDESRQCRSEVDVLDTERQQGQQDADRFLLIPGEDQGQRQVVDGAVESASQGDGDLDRRVGVVALAHVHDARERTDLAEVQVVETELAAGQGQDEGVLRGLLDEIGVVVAAGLGAVAAADEEDVLEGAGFDGVDDLAGSTEDGGMAEAGQQLGAAVDAGHG